MVGRPAQAVLDEELVESVRGEPRLDSEHFGCGGRGGHAEHRPTIGTQLLDRWRQRGGLPSARGPDDQDQLSAAGHCSSDLALGTGQ